MYRLASLMLAVSLLVGCGPSGAELERQRQAELKRQQDERFEAAKQAIFGSFNQAVQAEQARQQQYQQPTYRSAGAICNSCGAHMPGASASVSQMCPACVRAARYSRSY